MDIRDNFTEDTSISKKEKDEDELISLLEQFSDKLGAAEKEVLDPSGRNRRRRTDDNVASKASQEVKSLHDEIMSSKKMRNAKRSKFNWKSLLQIVMLLLIAALIYYYGSRISARLPALQWRSGAKVKSDGSKLKSALVASSHGGNRKLLFSTNILEPH